MADKQDRPGGMLEIPDSLGRDLDKAAQGKIPAPPIEAFMSDSALAEIERSTKARDAAVHAESLIPIHPAEAARRRTQHGTELPRMPAMRRVIPAPYRRPRVSGGTHGKAWAYVRADQVREGDIVPGVGRVEQAAEQVVYITRAEALGADMTPPAGADPAMAVPRQVDFGDLGEQVAAGTVVVLTGAGGEVKALRPGDQVRVFRAAVSGE